MKEKQIQSFRKTLIDWYSANRRDLPWRKTKNPYHIWVSEVMLQQTQVNTVLPFYPKFLNAFPDLKHLADADLQDVLKIWEGMGYYARSRNLHKAAGIVMNQYAGIIPDRWKTFRELPGVGDYIAAAVLSMAFGKPYPVVDGNVKRVLSRLTLIEAPVNKSSSTKHFQETAKEMLDKENPGTYNQALMELGAMICRPQRPLCGTCPVQAVCLAYLSDRVAEFPKKIKRQPTPQYRIAVGIVFKNGQVLITRRKLEGLLGGLWEFPGGKIRDGERAEAACIREIQEEVHLKIKIDSYLCRVKHAYTHFKILMDVFCCSYVSGRVKLNGPVDHRWIKLDKLKNYPLPRANHKFIPQLKQYTASANSRNYDKPDDAVLRTKLTPVQYKVTQEEGTEPPFQNEYWDNKMPGIYVDVVSGEPLFISLDKFDSGTGWPSFTKPLKPENIIEKEDRHLFTVRTEVRSRHGDSHLGHLFPDGPEPTGLRYCINSASLRFIHKKDLEKEGYGEYLKLFEGEQ